MAWTVILENEKRVTLKQLDEEFYSECVTNEKLKEAFLLLKYLNPYGDTIFNSLQCEDLIIDFEKLKKLDANYSLLDDLIEMAKNCRRNPHTYIVFYGD